MLWIDPRTETRGDLARKRLPARGDVRRQRHQLRPLQRARRARRAVPVRRRRRGDAETRVELTEVDGFVWHCYLPDRAARPALRLPRARPVRPRARACGATPPSCCSTPTPRRPPAQIDWDHVAVRLRLRRPRLAQRRRLRRRTCCTASSSTRSSTGRATAASTSPTTRADLRGPRQGPHPAAPGRPRGAARHLRRPGAPGGHRATSPSSA